MYQFNWNFRISGFHLVWNMLLIDKSVTSLKWPSTRQNARKRSSFEFMIWFLSPFVRHLNQLSIVHINSIAVIRKMINRFWIKHERCWNDSWLSKIRINLGVQENERWRGEKMRRNERSIIVITIWNTDTHSILFVS